MPRLPAWRERLILLAMLATIAALLVLALRGRPIAPPHHSTMTEPTEENR
jgi:hypothetical protein